MRRTLFPLVGLSRWSLPAAVRGPLLLANVVRGETAYYLGDIRTILSANVTAIALATDAGLPPAARARAFAFLGYLAGMLRLAPVARMAFRAGRSTGNPGLDGRPSAYSCAAEAVWHLSFGRWHEARVLLDAAWQHASSPPEPHQLEIIITLLALADYFEGDDLACSKRFDELGSRARARDNALHEAWSLYGKAEAMLLQNELDGMNALLSDAERLLEKLADRQSNLICIGLRAQMHYRLGDHSAAFQCTRIGTLAAKQLAANNFSALEGFAGPAEVAWRLAEGMRESDANSPEVHALANVAMSQLRRFARVHPIGLPRYLLCSGLKARTQGELDLAKRLFLRGVHAAQAQKMPAEERRLAFELAGTSG